MRAESPDNSDPWANMAPFAFETLPRERLDLDAEYWYTVRESLLSLIPRIKKMLS